MTITLTHDEVLTQLAEQYRPILDQSTDGVYLWLDEEHMVCNALCAKLFGYTMKEWSKIDSFLETLVAPEDREMFASNYQTTVARLTHPVTFRFRGLRKDGTTFAAETDMIPITFQGHAVAYHFVRELAE
ncbi:MAG: PAS domain S-box protein [Chloroflexi bacterium]|nr:PAS domain S-box protein [Chloroflexota bacterium]